MKDSLGLVLLIQVYREVAKLVKEKWGREVKPIKVSVKGWNWGTLQIKCTSPKTSLAVVLFASENFPPD